MVNMEYCEFWDDYLNWIILNFYKVGFINYILYYIYSKLGKGEEKRKKERNGV